jgi:hypothetical protein
MSNSHGSHDKDSDNDQSITPWMMIMTICRSNTMQMAASQFIIMRQLQPTCFTQMTIKVKSQILMMVIWGVLIGMMMLEVTLLKGCMNIPLKIMTPTRIAVTMKEAFDYVLIHRLHMT